MNTKGYGNIPSTLYECITFIATGLPVRSVPTFIELLVGAMITQAGFVTEAWLAINPVRRWNAYYKWLQYVKWSWVALGIQMARLMVTCFPQPIWFILFDNTFIYRCSKKAPGKQAEPPLTISRTISSLNDGLLSVLFVFCFHSF